MGRRQLSLSALRREEDAAANRPGHAARRCYALQGKRNSYLTTAAGVTLIELIIAMAILSILMSGILPLSYMTYKRSREIELHQNLRIVRTALDDYKKKVDEGQIPKDSEGSGYPPNLDVLVMGVASTDPVPVIYKFLRRIPRDPMTEDGTWGLRAYADERGSDIWGGQDVYDIYSQSEEQALDGTNYRDW